MKTVTCLLVVSLTGLVLSSPTSAKDKKVTLTKIIYSERIVKYTGQHEIVSLLAPVNAINFEDKSSQPNLDGGDTGLTLFFAEADVDSNGKRIDRGFYIHKGGKATKLLEHGRDATASVDNSTSVYIAAEDGIYVYNKENNTVEKYGTVDDSVIGIVKERTGDVMYILTENHEVFKVSNNGLTTEKLEDVVNAKQIVLDYYNNLYFYTDDNHVYVRTAAGVKKIEGLPEESNSVYLVRPPVVLDEGVIAVMDNAVYIANYNGTGDHMSIEFKPLAKPSAYAPEMGIIQYLAYDKKIYEFNIMTLITSSQMKETDGYVRESVGKILPMFMVTKSRPNKKGRF